MDLSELDSFSKCWEMENMNSELQGHININSYGFNVTGDDGWAQFIQDPQLSCLQSPKRPPVVDNNKEPFFLENGAKAEDRKDDSGILLSKCTSSLNSTPCILSFGGPASPAELDAIPAIKRESNQSITARRHVIAERKRRKRVTELIRTLSALVPGLEKRDKASVLTETIDYIKHMQEKVKTLQQQAVAENRNAEAELKNEKPKLVSVSSTDERNPKIEIKVFGNAYLIKMPCFHAGRGTLMKALNLVESHHLRVLSANSVQFSEQILDLTILAEVEEGFGITVKDLLQKLQLEFKIKHE